MISYLVTAFQIGLAVTLILSFSIFLPARWGAPWVSTPQKMVRRMLSLADIRPGSRLVDLGAGDGRIVVEAAYLGCHAAGVEIDPLRWLVGQARILAAGLSGKAEMIWGDLFEYDLSHADVVTVFLTRETNQLLRPHFENNLKTGSKVVSRAFPVYGWTPLVIDEKYLIFVYEIGKSGEDTNFRFV